MMLFFSRRGFQANTACKLLRFLKVQKMHILEKTIVIYLRVNGSNFYLGIFFHIFDMKYIKEA